MKSVVVITVAAIAGVSYAAPKIFESSVEAVKGVPLWKLWVIKRQLTREELPPQEKIYKDGETPTESLHHRQGWPGASTETEKPKEEK